MIEVVPTPSDNPFDTVDIVKSSVEEAKSNVLHEAKDMLGAAYDLHNLAKTARKRGNTSLMGRIVVYAQGLMKMASEFIRQAVVIAIAKFVLEFCALIINSIMDYITGKIGNKNLEISTPNVFFSKGPQAPGQAAPTQQREPWARPSSQQDYSNPFDRVFSNSASSF